jgi:hypothetical protein
VTESFLTDLLATGEVVLIETRQHWVAAVRYLARPLVILLIAAFLVLFNNWLGWEGGILGTINQLILWVAALLFVVSLIWLPIDLVRWWSRRYVLTNRRAMRMQGVVRKSSIDSSLEQINDIRTEQSLLGRTLGYADLTIYTASDIANERYAQLLDGLQFKKAVLEAKNAIREGQPLTALPDDFVVRGGTNEVSIQKYGRAATPEPSPDAGTGTVAEAAPVAPTGVSAATAAAVMAAGDVIEPSGEVSSAAELSVPAELGVRETAAPAMPVVPGVMAPPAAVVAEPVAAEPVVAGAVPAEPVPAEPVPAEPVAPAMVVEPVAEVPSSMSPPSEDEATSTASSVAGDVSEAASDASDTVVAAEDIETPGVHDQPLVEGSGETELPKP